MVVFATRMCVCVSLLSVVGCQEGKRLLQTDPDMLISRISNLEKLISKMNATHYSEIASLKSQLAAHTAQQVAFSASLTTALSGLSQHRHIEYDKVASDTANAYNPSDGIFIVPVSGLYVFTWTITCPAGDYQTSELVVDGIINANLLVDSDSGDRGTGTQTVIIKVNQSQHVWIRTGTGDGNLEGKNTNSFSGWLLTQ